MILQLAEEAASMDWAGLSMAITAIGGIVVAVLQALGKREAADKAKQATAQATALVAGVEAASKGDHAPMAAQLKEFGVDLTPDQVALIHRKSVKAVKATIKKTAMEHDVGQYLRDLVRTTTSRMDPAELRKRLDKETKQE